MIEKNIFFVYDDKTKIANEFLNNIDVVKKQNPDYKVRLIDFKEFEEYYKEKDIDSYNNYYCKLNKNICAMVADYIRYVLIYYEGGVYLDVKSRPKIPLDNIIDDDNEMVLIDWKLFRNKKLNLRQYVNSFFMSKSNNIIFKKLIDKIHNNIDNYNPYKINLNHSLKNVIKFAGPDVLTEVVNENINDKIKIIPHNKKNETFVYFGIKNYQKLYNKPHYTQLKEHLIILN